MNIKKLNTKVSINHKSINKTTIEWSAVSVKRN